MNKNVEEKLEKGFSNFCGCNSYTGEKCTEHNNFEDYTGKFPMAKGTRGDHVEALQRFLVSKLVLVMGKTPYGYFGDATETGLKKLNLPIIINSEAELLTILGLEPITPVTPAVSQKPDVNLSMTNPKLYDTKWKDAAKDPNQFLSILDRAKGLFGKKPLNANTKVNVDNLPADSSTNTTASNTTNTAATAKKPVPTAVWIVGGLVVLILVVFLVMKMLKED